MCHNLGKQRRRIGDKPQKSKVVDTSCGYTRTNLRTLADKVVDTCADKLVDACGQSWGRTRTKCPPLFPHASATLSACVHKFVRMCPRLCPQLVRVCPQLCPRVSASSSASVRVCPGVCPQLCPQLFPQRCVHKFVSTTLCPLCPQLCDCVSTTFCPQPCVHNPFVHNPCVHNFVSTAFCPQPCVHTACGPKKSELFAIYFFSIFCARARARLSFASRVAVWAKGLWGRLRLSQRTMTLTSH